VIPEIGKHVPEALAFVSSNQCRGEWPEDEDECEERDAESRKAVAYELPVAFALNRTGREVSGEKKEKPHEVCLIGGDEQREQDAREFARYVEFVVEPAARCAIGDRCVMEENEGRHDGAEAVYVEVARRGTDGVIEGSGSGTFDLRSFGHDT
jgi:hypothetical protein